MSCIVQINTFNIVRSKSRVPFLLNNPLETGVNLSREFSIWRRTYLNWYLWHDVYYFYYFLLLIFFIYVVLFIILSLQQAISVTDFFFYFECVCQNLKTSVNLFCSGFLRISNFRSRTWEAGWILWTGYRSSDFLAIMTMAWTNVNGTLEWAVIRTYFRIRNKERIPIIWRIRFVLKSEIFSSRDRYLQLMSNNETNKEEATGTLHECLLYTTCFFN